MRAGTVLAFFALAGCSPFTHDARTAPAPPTQPYIIVLGTAQDGGYPQSGCAKAGCDPAWHDHSARRFVASLGLIDPATNERWMFDATPDFRDQLRILDSAHPVEKKAPGLSGIFLTHAHVGHYTGLMMLGREVLGAQRVAVHAMPRMKGFLESNGPWDQLVTLENIQLNAINANEVVVLNDSISVTPLLVPHRDEYSETVGFVIAGPTRKVLFLPDIDKWERWDLDIEEVVRQVDVAFVDATFFANGEIPGRDMADIPHPFIEETMDRLAHLSAEERARVRFIHLNHTNPALLPDSAAAKLIEKRGFRLARQGERIGI